MISEPLTIGCVGDIMLGRGVASALKPSSKPLFSTDVRRVLGCLDLRLANLECPLTTEHPFLNSGSLRGPEWAARHLQVFDVVSLANNHIFDCGDGGVEDTIDTLNAHGIAHVGVGLHGEDAYTPLLVRRRSGTVAIVSATETTLLNKVKDSVFEVAVLDSHLFLPAVEFAAKSADLLILMLHVGNEYVPLSPPSLRRTLRRLTMNCPSLILTHHPHILGGFERIGESHIIWHSLGDFLFDSGIPMRSQSAIVTFEANRDRIESPSVLPTICSATGQVDILQGQRMIRVVAQTKRASKLLAWRYYNHIYSALYLMSLAHFQIHRVFAVFRKQGFSMGIKFVVSRVTFVPMLVVKLMKGKHR